MKKFLSIVLICILALSLCAPAFADNVLRPGDKGEGVKVAQRLLKSYGYYLGSVDGSYGKATTSAVRKFQLYNNLTVDGKIGPKTNAVLTSGNAVSAPKNDDETVTDVEALQTLLKAYGYYNGKIDNVFGSGTEKALRAFQKANDLLEDGKLGPATIAALLSGNAVCAPVTQKGQEAEIVKHIQQRLAHYGYYTGKIDGVFGTGTIAATKVFQKANGLKVDGAVGEETLAKLNSDDAVYKTLADDKDELGKYPILRKNANNEYVKQAQSLLKTLDYYKGEVDGLYDDETIKAVKAYQKAVGLTADGKVGPKTWAKLLNLDPGVIPTPVPKPDDGVMRPGDEGDDVKALQLKLNTLGAKLKVDGKYGTKTTKAVSDFQKANGLKVDGKAGPLTMAKIDAKLAELK